MAEYEFYLTDDAGRRILLLNNAAFMSMSLSVLNYGTIHIGFPLDDFKVRPIFLPDRRVEVWRSPRYGATMRRERSFFLRKFNVYTRETDNLTIVEFWGRTPIDILRRQSVTSTTLADYEKTAAIDDMMKEIVDENFVTPPQTAPEGEFSVDGDETLGPNVNHSFFGKTVLDVIRELRDISISKNELSTSNRRIYFDVVEGDPLPTGGYGYTFRTYADIRGSDRRKGVIFSVENGNIKEPSYYEDHLDSFTVARILNLSTPLANGEAESLESRLSRWNTIVSATNTSETAATLNDAQANIRLQEGKADTALNVTFVDSPGSERQPRSLYGVDWDLGDLLPVRYAERDFNTEVMTVFVSVNEDGVENIIGLSNPRVFVPEEGTVPFTLLSSTLNADSTGWSGFTLVMRMETVALNLPPGVVTMMRVTFEASAAEPANIFHAYIGHAAAAGDAYDYLSTPVQLFWNGASTKTIAAGEQAVSDWAPFAYNKTSALIVSWYMQVSVEDGMRKLDGVASVNLYFRNANDAATVNKNAYTPSANTLLGIKMIESDGGS